MSNSFFLISASLSRSLSTNTYICLSIYLPHSHFLSICRSRPLSFHLSLSSSVFLFRHYLSLSLSPSSLSLSFFLSSLFPSIPVALSLSLSLTLTSSVPLSVFLFLNSFFFFVKDFEPDAVMYPRGEEPSSDFKRCVDAYKVCNCSLDRSLFFSCGSPSLFWTKWTKIILILVISD